MNKAPFNQEAIDKAARERIRRVEDRLERANKRIAVVTVFVLFLALATGWVQW